METKAVSKYNRISARKLRLVADMIRGQKVISAFSILKFTPKKAARLVEKTLKSATANAENNFSMDKKDLVIKTIMVDEGPTLKRHQPRSKGMANPIRKRTAHVTLIVGAEEKTNKREAEETAKVTNVNKKEETVKLVKGSRPKPVAKDDLREVKNGS